MLLNIFKEKDILKIFFYICLFMSLGYICHNFYKLNYAKNIYQFILALFFNCVFMQIPFGYFVRLINNIIQKETRILPQIDIIQDVIIGLKYFVALTLPFLFVLSIKFVLLYLNQSLYKSIETVFILSFLIIFFTFLPTFICIFATKRYWTSFISLKRAFLLIKNNLLPYIKTLLICLLILAIGAFFHDAIFAIDNYIKSDVVSLLIISSLDAIFSTIPTFIICVFIAQSINQEDFDKFNI